MTDWKAIGKEKQLKYELNLINKGELESFLNKPVYNSTDQTVGSISWCG